MFMWRRIIVTAISSNCDRSTFRSALSQAVPGPAERTLLEERSGSFNERRALRVANELLFECYNRAEDERRRRAALSPKHTRKKETSRMLPVFVLFILSLATIHPFLLSLIPSSLFGAIYLYVYILSSLFCLFAAQTCYPPPPPLSLCHHLSLSLLCSASSPEHNKLADSHSVCTSGVVFLWGDKLAR